MLTLVLTIVFGALNVVQFAALIRDWKDRQVWKAHRSHMVATRDELRAIRAMLNEAIENKEIIKTDDARQLMRAIAYQLVGVEGHFDAMLGEEASAKGEKTPVTR